MLKINNMKVKYHNTTIIEDISFKIKENTVTTLIGPNGCGKSTILKTITKSKKPLSGEIYLNNKNIYSIKEKDLAQIMTILPQSPKVPEDFTVRDLVEYGRFPHSSFMSRLSKRDHQIIDWAIESTKIENLQHRKIETLSGGERQRAWIAMALAQEPRLLLLDEPTTYLDICHQFEILELIKRLNREMGITVVMVLHDINQAARYSNKIIAIKNKKIYIEGEPREILTEKLLEDVFNIRSKILEDKDNNCPYFLPIKNKESKDSIEVSKPFDKCF